LLANREVEVTIENPVGLFLFANLKLCIRTPLRPQLFRGLHLQIRRD